MPLVSPSLSIVQNSLHVDMDVDSVSVMAASRQGVICYWPSMTHEESCTEIALDLGNDWKCLTAVSGGGFILASQKNQLLRLTPDGSGKVSFRPVQEGQGMLSGLGRRVSSLFGILTPTADVVLSSVLWDVENECFYTLTNSSLNKWEVDETSERHIFSWDLNRSMKRDLGDSIWGDDENYEATKSAINMRYLDLQLSKAGKLRAHFSEFNLFDVHILPAPLQLQHVLAWYSVPIGCDGILGAGSFTGLPVLFCRNS
eukprot:g46954.t1